MNTFPHTLKRPFALAEVCIALIILSIAASYAFSSLRNTIGRYAYLREEITCHELADEYLGQYLASFLMNPPDFDTAVSGRKTRTSDHNFDIVITDQIRDQEEKKSGDSSKESLKKAHLVNITVSVKPCKGEQIVALRTTSLCIAKEEL